MNSYSIHMEEILQIKISNSVVRPRKKKQFWHLIIHQMTYFKNTKYWPKKIYVWQIGSNEYSQKASSTRKILLLSSCPHSLMQKTWVSWIVSSEIERLLSHSYGIIFSIKFWNQLQVCFCYLAFPGH